MPVLHQKHATHRWVRLDCYEWVSLLFVYKDAGVVEVVEMLSRRYIEDVDVELQ